MSPQFEISKRSKYNFDIIDVTGSLSHRETQKIQKYIENNTDANTQKVILNLKEVPFINSNALFNFVEITKLLSNRNIDFVLMNVRHDISNILLKNNLKNFFKIIDNEEELIDRQKEKELNDILDQPD